jgi:hypothetical protein
VRKLTQNGVAPILPYISAMVTAHHPVQEAPIRLGTEEWPRRSATVGALDARLSVWGQAARDGAARRAEVLVDAALVYVEKVGRTAEVLQPMQIDPAAALLDLEYAPLVELAANLIPGAVSQSCRLLWVDPDRLRERLSTLVAPAIEAARGEVRRRQALYRRRARLWQNDQPRLDRLRDEIESMRVPRCVDTARERIVRGLLIRHRDDGGLGQTDTDAADSRLKVRPGTIARWISQLDERISADQA